MFTVTHPTVWLSPLCLLMLMCSASFASNDAKEVCHMRCTTAEQYCGTVMHMPFNNNSAMQIDCERQSIDCHRKCELKKETKN